MVKSEFSASLRNQLNVAYYESSSNYFLSISGVFINEPVFLSQGFRCQSKRKPKSCKCFHLSCSVSLIRSSCCLLLNISECKKVEFCSVSCFVLRVASQIYSAVVQGVFSGIKCYSSTSSFTEVSSNCPGFPPFAIRLADFSSGNPL